MVKLHTIHHDPNVEYTAPNFVTAVYRQGSAKDDYCIRETLNPEKVTIATFPRDPQNPNRAGHASVTFTDADGESVNVSLNYEAIEFLAREILEA